LPNLIRKELVMARRPVVGRRRRYPSDTTAAEWSLIEPMLPSPAWRAGRGGRPERHDRRAVVDAIRYIVDNGAKWRSLPSDYPPWQTVHGFYTRWAAAGVLGHLVAELHQRIRTERGYAPRAVTVVIDSQSVKAAETVGAASRGYDPAKKINGRKRAVVVDLGGLPLMMMVVPASMTDRDTARELLFRLRLTCPEVVQVYADSAYSGELVAWAKKFLGMTISVVSRPAGATGFVLLPRRWVVERTLSWLLRARRNVRDYERLPQHSEAALTWSAITLMTRRLTRRTGREHGARAA
jgi:transposase